jgi:molybdenum cofactor synthesis domain-containing protein
MRARVIVASDRAATGTYADRSGALAAAGLRDMGFEVDKVLVVPDGHPVAAAVHSAVASGCSLVVTTGGTGIGPRDLTPDVVAPLLDKELPHLAAAIAARGAANGVPTAALSRGIAGIIRRTLVVCLPGSTGGVRDGIAVLADVAVHAVEQLNGSDHG